MAAVIFHSDLDHPKTNYATVSPFPPSICHGHVRNMLFFVVIHLGAKKIQKDSNSCCFTFRKLFVNVYFLLFFSSGEFIVTGELHCGLMAVTWFNNQGDERLNCSSVVN